MAVTVGMTVGNYRIERLLGAGGHAEVWQARHLTLESPAAIKVLHAASHSLTQRLISEGRAQASLRHPHIVSVVDVIDISGSPALVLEFVDGPSLAEWTGGKPLPPPELERVFRAILAGVEAAHGRGMVHRDLKPANVLMDTRSSPPVPKVADFGLVRWLGEQRGPTRTGVAMGTLGYMAPEQLRDSAHAGARADVHALGCILYELATGSLPYAAQNLIAYHVALETRAFVPASTRVAGLPRRVDAVIAACLAYDEEARPADAAAVLALLDAPERPVVSAIASSAGSKDTFDSARVVVEQTSSAGEASLPAHATVVPMPRMLGESPRARRGIFIASAVVLAAVVVGLLLISVPGAPGPNPAPGSAETPGALPDERGMPAPNGGLLAGGESSEVPPGIGDSPQPGPDGGEEGGKLSGDGPAEEPGGPPVPPRANGRPPPRHAEREAVTDVPDQPAELPITPTGQFSVEDPSFAVRLEAGGKSYGPGSVPPGHYEVTADFGDGRKSAGEVDIAAGAVVTFRCAKGGGRCAVLGR